MLAETDSYLIEALRKAKVRFEQHKELFERDESVVRERFVLPLLRALGWDTEDPGEVYPEVNINNSGPDYLLKVDGVSLLAVDVRNSQ